MLEYLDSLSASESDSDAELETILLYLRKSKKKKKPNSEYLKKRNTHGEFSLNKELCDERFINYFRLNREEFKEVHTLIQPIIHSEGCNAQKPIGTEEKLEVFLRYLASGDSYKSIAHSYRMGDRTVSKIVNEVSRAIWKTIQPMYLPQPTEEMWISIASDFETIWNFPHCVGAIEGKHVVIKKPNKSGSLHYNYKGDLSIVLMAAVDAKYKFTFIEVGPMGRFSDGSIFSICELEKKMAGGSLHLPSPSEIPNSENIFPYVFVADEGFPLQINVMRPYPRRSVMQNFENKVFNDRLSRARQTAECAFGILASRFRVFRRPFENKVTSVVDIVKAACVLHNYLRRNSTVTSDIGQNESNENLSSEQLVQIQRNLSRSLNAAFSVRKIFTEYFNSVGSVPWQEESVSLRHN
ncbi:uncharacterized protein LOC123675638 [Harmonia axyridis]|uniref:uncharacterized protein LOC123675638 n=1 Tax=Harmonia axyridis TaxID=115357 RepID=UPI001E2778DE|nr:uncharacterized protein LOC123675638 [Harmonia axyridis]